MQRRVDWSKLNVKGDPGVSLAPPDHPSQNAQSEGASCFLSPAVGGGGGWKGGRGTMHINEM